MKLYVKQHQKNIDILLKLIYIKGNSMKSVLLTFKEFISNVSPYTNFE